MKNSIIMAVAAKINQNCQSPDAEAHCNDMCEVEFVECLIDCGLNAPELGCPRGF